MKECPRCLFTDDFAIIGEKQCNYCDLHDQLEDQANPENLPKEIQRIKNKGRGKQYDCIMGISGGLDSSTLLYMAVKVWGLKPLVIHFDNGWNNDIATANMHNLVTKLSVPYIVFGTDTEEYNRLNMAFLNAGLPDADIPNDIAMTKLMYDTAHKYGIKYILNGHCFRTEGSTPKGWTYMDAKYICSVYSKMTGKELKNYPLFTFKDQLYYAWKGIKNVRPFHYLSIDERKQYEERMINFTGWQSYGGKHCENIYTEFVGSYYLPQLHHIDKRIVYISALVRSQQITKKEGKMKMNAPVEFDLNKLRGYTDEIKGYLNDFESNQKQRIDFDRYNFRKYRLFIWMLAKMKVVPYTFYVKYCK